MRTLWCCHFLGKRTGNIRFNVIYEEPFSPCFLFLYLLLQTYPRSNPIGGRVFFFLLSLSFITIHDCMHVCSTYDSLYACFIRKNRPRIKNCNVVLKKKGKKVCRRTGSYFQSSDPQQRTLPVDHGSEGISGKI